jgi:hypothetical protein
MKAFFLKKIEDLTLNIVKSLEVEIQEVSVRVMTSELHSNNEEIPTFLFRGKDISLKKAKKDLKKSYTTEFNSASILANLMNDKIFKIGEVSIHLLREAVIEQCIEYKKDV